MPKLVQSITDNDSILHKEDIVNSYYMLKYGDDTTFRSKSESDTDVPIDTNITPGKRRTTAQKTQAAFKLKEEVQKKLEQQTEKYGDS